MTNDQITIGVLTGLLVAKGLFSAWLFAKLRQSHSQCAELSIKLIKVGRLLRDQEALTIGAIASSLTQKNNLDQKTTSLVKMAIGNRNENESRVAAMEACKRIAKQLGIK